MLDWLLFFAVPCLFSSNIIFGRGILGEIGPFITAFIRWMGAFILIFPFIYKDKRACFTFMRHHTVLWLLLGFLGMGICGGLVYWALTVTTASNATLIYTTSSLFIILFQWLFQGRALNAREVLGMMIAFAGITVIVLKGDVAALRHMQFNIGDFGVLAAAIAFAIYSMLLRHPAVSRVAPFSLFGLLALSGAVVLLVPAAVEVTQGGVLPTTGVACLKLAGIIVFASVLAFYSFQHTVRVFGPAIAGTTLYLMPPVSIVMAVAFLGERFETYHAIGIALVMAGVILATAPKDFFKRHKTVL
ncbi:DMT family transporter [Rhizobium sp.]|uniref:DMT family transporter n=1 Tax=Rhizobium sp. TaxID=391 RepID=UPI002AA690A0